MAERVALGWDAGESEPWLLRAGEVAAHRVEYEQWWDEADVVIAGYWNIDRLADRLRRGKLTFYMSERWWKPPIGVARLLHPRFALKAARFRRLAQSSYLHFLPIGGYAATDMRRMASFNGRSWDWGYFLSIPEPLPLCRERLGTFRVLWAGRFLSWKRVDTLVRAFALLREQDPDSHLTLVGVGPCRGKMVRLTEELRIAGHVTFLPSMPPPRVRELMRNAHVYVLPSSPYEGWGAVLNEAMSDGCAVVASSGAGSAKTMVRHGQNGLLFEPGDYRQLGRLLVQLSEDESLRRRLAEAGQRTIVDCWSPDIGAERLLCACDALLSRRPVPVYSGGPMAAV